MKKLALHWKIIIGLILGVAWGFAASFLGFTKFTSDWIAPFGTIFINVLKLIAIPMVMVSLVVGVSSLKDISSLSNMGSKAVLIYIITTVISITVGLTIVNVVKPGHYFSEEKREEFKQQYASKVSESTLTAEKVKKGGPLQPLVEIVPDNLFTALGDNKRMLQVIFFSILFGVAMVMLPTEKTQGVRNFFDGANEIVLKMVDIIMLTAPYGVFALMGSLVTDFAGDDPSQLFELFSALGLYSLTVVGGLAIMIFLVYPAMLKFIAKKEPVEYIKGILPAQMLAFSTSSSAAALPVNMECCEKNNNIPEEVTSFVLPLGATVNMDGTSLYQAIATVFIAQAFGTDLDISQQLMIVFTATLASIGAAPVPGAGMVMLIIILQSVGIAPEGLALIFAVDRILDMCRTVANVTSDATVAAIIAKGIK